jgi:hypothetical protein
VTDINQPPQFTDDEKKAQDLMKQMVIGFVRMHHPHMVLQVLQFSPGAWNMILLGAAAGLFGAKDSLDNLIKAAGELVKAHAEVEESKKHYQPLSTQIEVLVQAYKELKAK